MISLTPGKPCRNIVFRHDNIFCDWTLLRCMSPLMARIGGSRVGRACPLCPGISDVNLFRYCQCVIDLNAEISDRAFDLCMPKQELDSPEIACPAIDQGSFCAAQ